MYNLSLPIFSSTTFIVSEFLNFSYGIYILFIMFYNYNFILKISLLVSKRDNQINNKFSDIFVFAHSYINMVISIAVSI